MSITFRKAKFEHLDFYVYFLAASEVYVCTIEERKALARELIAAAEFLLEGIKDETT